LLALFYLVAKLIHVGFNVDELAHSYMHAEGTCPSTKRWLVPSLQWDGYVFLEDAKLSSLDI
jgi:hypothetical protein